MTINFNTQQKQGFQVGQFELLQNTSEEFIPYLLAALSIVRHRLHHDNRPVYLLTDGVAGKPLAKARKTRASSGDAPILVRAVPLPIPEDETLAAWLTVLNETVTTFANSEPLHWNAIPVKIRQQAICLSVTDSSETPNDLIHDEIPLLTQFVLNKKECSIQFPTLNRLVDQGDLAFIWSYWHQLYQQISLTPNQSIGNVQLVDIECGEICMGQGDILPFDFTKTINELFADQCRQRGQQTAVIDIDASGQAQASSYQAIQVLAQQIASKLAIPFTPVPGMGIGVFLERSHRVPAAILGIWQAGEVYVPLESSLPDATLDQIINDAGISMVLTEKTLLHRPFLKGVQTINIDDLGPVETSYSAYQCSLSAPTDLAMIFYTSGSTGVPKGVMHSQMHLLNRFNWLWETYPFQEGDVMCQRTTLNFMPSMWELFGGVLNGVPVVIMPDAVVKDPEAFATQLQKQQVSCVNIVPSLLKMMREGSGDLMTKLSRVRWWITCGEPLSPDMLQWLQKTFPQALLLNDHGATEVNGVLYFDSTHRTNGNSIPYSLPIANVTVHILDDQKRRLPAYVPGELYISGNCLAIGYLDEALTRQKFINSPTGQVLFKLGDWGYFDKEGRIRSLGRMDNVVKVRGNRVDLGGVEQLLVELEDVRECVVLAEKNSENAATILAFIVPQSSALTVGAIREKAFDLMPDFMVPQRFLLLNELPRLINGKIDRETLRNSFRKPAEAPAPLASEVPSFDKQMYLDFCREQAAELLDVPGSEINFQKKFYEIGFNSASLVTFTNALNKRFSLSLRVSDLYNYPVFEEFLDFALSSSKLIATSAEAMAKPEFSKSAANTPEEIDFFSVPPFPSTSTPAPVYVSEVSDDQIETLLVQFACEVLEAKPDEIDRHKKYYALGFNSASLVSFLTRINGHFGLTISVAVIYNKPTISELADYIRSQTPGMTLLPTIPVNVADSLLPHLPALGKTDSGSSDSDPFAFFSPVAPDVSPVEAPVVEDGAAEPIAIVGLSGKFPYASDVQAFWNMLSQGKSGVTLVPANRWDYQDVFDSEMSTEGKTNSKWGGFVENIDRFDAAFFNISPMEATLMDPQQRLCLEESWKALENAGYDEDSLQQKKVGIFIGMRPGDYQNALSQNDVSPSAYTLMGNDLAILSARLAYYLNLKGPAITVDTACSSSLVAVHMAIQSIRAGDCEMALAGGVHLMTTPNLHITSAKMNMLSPDGQCKTFANSADGFVPGEGVGVVVLKKLRNAQLDGDQISGIILGSSLNQDGRTNGITAPSGSAQTDLQTQVYQRFNIDPRSISYVEAHGTGTKLGDPIEIQSLTDSFRQWTKESAFCRIGSVKTNIGHGVAAAGVAGLMKVLMAFKHRQIPPSLHFTQPNENIDFSKTPFVVNTSLTDWVSAENPLRAAINSFGFSGTNAHLVLEAAPLLPDNRPLLPTYLFPLSAKSAEALTQKIKNVRVWLAEQQADLQPSDLSYTLCRAHSRYPYRVCIAADTVTELSSALDEAVRLQAYGNRPGIASKTTTDVPFASFLSFYGQTNKAAYRVQMTAMAQAITAGATYDWSALFAGTNYRVISLPAYPFAQTTYWVAKKAAGRTVSQLHIRQTQPSTFDVEFSGLESFLTQHRYQNRALLPGVAYLYLIRLIARRFFRNEVMQMRDVVWIGPFYYEVNQPLIVDWASTPENGATRVSFYRGSLTSSNLVCQAHVEYKLTDSSPQLLDIDRFRGKCQRPVLREEIYGAYEAMQIGYGNLFRPLQLAYTGSGVAWAELETPTSDDPYYEIYLLDGALQSALTLQLEQASETPDLPFSIGTISFHQTLPRSCSVYTQSAEGSEPQSYRSDLTLCDDEGTILIHIQDFCQRSADGKIPSARAGSTAPQPHVNASVVALETSWKPAILPAVTVPSAATLLVFDAGRQLYDSLVEELTFRGLNNRIILVQDDTGRPQAELPGLSVSIKATGTPERYSLVWQHLREQGLADSELYIIWNWSGLFGDSSAPETGQISQTYALTDLVQSAAIIGVKALRLLNLRVGADEQINPFYAAFSGFAKSIHKEYPAFYFTTLQYIALPGERPAVGQSVIQELFAPVLPDQVRYRGNNQRQVNQLCELEWPMSATSHSVLSQGQVILITGGAGGVGLALARQFGLQYGAKLILTGRSAIDATLRAKIKALQDDGIDITYQSADISIEADVQRLLAGIRANYQSIQGIIHAAGQLRDGLFLTKTRQDWDDVGQAKIQGLLLLNHLTQNDPLDFLVVCSSVSAVTGNIGQSDYAYANAFMDAFVTYRNQQRDLGRLSGKTYTINWPLWEQGGMQLTDLQANRIADEFGLQAMPDEVGMHIIKQLLQTDRESLVVAYGDPALIAKRGLLGEIYRQSTHLQGGAAAERSTLPASPLSDTASVDYRADVEAIFIHELADLLQMSERDIVSSRPLSELGLDSILLNEVSQRIYSRLQIRLSPTIFFEHRTVKAIITYLLTEHASSLETRFGKAKLPIESPAPVILAPTARPLTVAPVAQVPVKPEQEDDTRIAIVGISGVFPGCQDVTDFYEKLKAGQSMLTEVPASRWAWESYYGDPLADEHKTNVTYGGFIEGIENFDASFFGISPAEAILMDPQQRLFIEHTWKAIEDAGYALDSFRERQTGVFVGAFTHEYEEMILRRNIPTDFMLSTGNVNAIIANRVSNYFDFKGPSEVVDTACSSSLVALHRAIQAIRYGDCDQAIVGGVNALISPYGFMAPAQARLLTTEDSIFSFGERANGYLRGEGAGVAILKRLTDARRDGDHIYGVVAGSAVAHSGRSYSLTAPSSAGQEEVIRRALADARLEPDSINYIEAHGTGTTLGDAVELNTYKRIFQTDTACAISTAKPNIGHLEAASGITSLFKVLLSMQHQLILPVRNFTTLQADVTLENTGLHIVQTPTRWESLRSAKGQEQPLRASLHSFGFGGVNAHLILEEAPSLQSAGECRLSTNLFVFSAKDASTLLTLVEQFIVFGENHPQINLTQVACTLQMGREAMPVRLALAADTLDELLDTLRQFRQDAGAGEVRRGACNINETKNASVESLLHDQAFLAMLLEQAVSRQLYPQLLSLWVLGADFDWNKLYATKPTRLSLPVYPFNKKRHWILDKPDPLRPDEPAPEPTSRIVAEQLTPIESVDSRDELIRACAEILGVTVQDVCEERSLVEQGMTSIQKIRFKYEVENAYGINISMPQFGNTHSLRDLRVLVAQLGDRKESLAD
ncbi:SDR family NAD(P)-dependent oxidoreductase [Spirosoma fluviale]|uniref:Amino acid adenylation domain-containing protein n=1 Tax=Spirosoma fluviale TaxID=1597977 RepID=A0A286GUD6_9BACT|nr:SDR family NAD(P)-dependent oxidoreductase [Spirosoma fluviale]SOD99155.1 amino acid adenylation domain-containing protein [Spirosoma fluviale]